MNKPTPIEQNGQRVLATAQLAESFGTDIERIQVNFNRNKERFTEGKHFILLQGEELKQFKATYQIDNQLKFASSLYLWTEKGAWMHAKSLNTDQAWEAYEALVDDYYTVKQQSIDTSLLSPELQMFKQIFDSVAKVQIEQSETRQQLQTMQTAVTTIKETIVRHDDEWRESINKMLQGAAYRMGGNYQELRTESYVLLEDRGKCDLNTRLRNLKDRLFESGATKTKINNTTKMDVIESDPRLREIYTTIVKELSIGTLKI